MLRNYVARYRLHNLDARKMRERERESFTEIWNIYIPMARDEAFDAL